MIRSPRSPLRLALLTTAALAVLSASPSLGGFAGALAAGLPSAQPPLATPAGPPSLADLVNKVKPAVVTVTTTQKVAANSHAGGPNGSNGDDDNGGPSPFPPGSPGEEFFRHFFDQQPGHGFSMPPGHGHGQPHESQALGSGFVVDPDGWIVTNNHVVGEADEIEVLLNDGTSLPAKIKGRDPKTDLALLKVEAGHPLPFVTFGDTAAVHVGDWVLAVGNPFGLGGSVTAGIVSANGRDINSGPYDDFLQIDAPINRGNSGGPTFDMRGLVVGINTAIYSPNGGSVGIGFAIPAGIAKPVIEQLLEHGKVDRGWLGVEIQKVTPDIAESMGLDKPKGALVAGINKEGPAFKAGFKNGDLITRFNGIAIEDMRDLPRAVAATKAGSKVDVVVKREGHDVTLPVTIAPMPDDKVLAQTEPAPPAGPGETTLGLDLSIDSGAVVVSSVDGASAAAAKGIQAGDRILAANQLPVRAPADVKAAVAGAKEHGRKAVLLLVEHEGHQRFIAVPVG